MTGMGFDGLVVNHGGLSEITDHLYKMVKDIDDRMNRLESELAPLKSDWHGNAQQAYTTAKAKWDWAIQEMRDLLDESHQTVYQSNAEYQAADKRGAAQFEI